MSDTINNTTKQFLDKDGLNALWDKICSVFASKQELEDLGNSIPVIPDIPEVSIISMQMIDAVWEDVIGHDDAILDEGKLNTRKLG
jgi:hypothetical protein